MPGGDGHRGGLALPCLALPGGDSGSGGKGVVQQSEGCYLDPECVLAKCRSVLEQDTEPPTTPDVQVDSLDSRLSYRCMYGGMSQALISKPL